MGKTEQQALASLMRWIETRKGDMMTQYPSRIEVQALLGQGINAAHIRKLEQTGYLIGGDKALIPTAKAWVWWFDYKRGLVERKE